MAKVILEALASSSAHGISRAAGTRNLILRVAWLLAFLLFLSLFCHGAISLIWKLMNVTIVTISEIDKVPFQLPDMYFCPSRLLSGSYPYVLNETEARIINAEIGRLEESYDKFMAQPASEIFGNSAETKVKFILNSLTPETLSLLLKRPDQSVNMLHSHRVESRSLSIESAVFNDEKRLCFKSAPNLQGRFIFPAELYNRNSLASSFFTDTYTSHFKYSGYPIRPIRDPINSSLSIPFSEWDFVDGIRRSVSSDGFIMLLVAPNTFPSVMVGPVVRLAPGRSYDVTVTMEEVVYSEDLHGVNCTKNPPNLSFLDLLTGRKLSYSYSYPGCYMSQRVRDLLSNIGSVTSPIPWDLRHSPRAGNITHLLQKNASELKYGRTDTTQICMTPCSSLRYKTTISFDNWPVLSGKFSSACPQGRDVLPVMSQLKRMARQLDEGNHSAQLESVFRKFISDTMLRVEVRPQSALATRLVISKSYTVTSFLADIGGLLGLYIGCSMLTVCELLELLYHLIMLAINKRHKGKEDQAAREGGNDEDRELQTNEL